MAPGFELEIDPPGDPELLEARLHVLVSLRIAISEIPHGPPITTKEISGGVF
jgi:hypothetical protein